MRSAADMEDVGCPDPAAVVQRMLSTRSCAASSFHSFSWSAMALPSSSGWGMRTTTAAPCAHDRDGAARVEGEPRRVPWAHGTHASHGPHGTCLRAGIFLLTRPSGAVYYRTITARRLDGKMKRPGGRIRCGTFPNPG